MKNSLDSNLLRFVVICTYTMYCISCNTKGRQHSASDSIPQKTSNFLTILDSKVSFGANGDTIEKQVFYEGGYVELRPYFKNKINGISRLYNESNVLVCEQFWIDGVLISYGKIEDELENPLTFKYSRRIDDERLVGMGHAVYDNERVIPEKSKWYSIYSEEPQQFNDSVLFNIDIYMPNDGLKPFSEVVLGTMDTNQNIVDTLYQAGLWGLHHEFKLSRKAFADYNFFAGKAVILRLKEDEKSYHSDTLILYMDNPR